MFTFKTLGAALCFQMLDAHEGRAEPTFARALALCKARTVSPMKVSWELTGHVLLFSDYSPQFSLAPPVAPSQGHRSLCPLLLPLCPR